MKKLNIIGDWNNNKREGYGKNTSINGDIYEGIYYPKIKNLFILIIKLKDIG
jgi:hypothetical protein